ASVAVRPERRARRGYRRRVRRRGERREGNQRGQRESSEKHLHDISPMFGPSSLICIGAGTDRSAPAGGKMCPAAPPRCDGNHIFRTIQTDFAGAHLIVIETGPAHAHANRRKVATKRSMSSSSLYT